jgi:hypothetical protein
MEVLLSKLIQLCNTKVKFSKSKSKISRNSYVGWELDRSPQIEYISSRKFGDTL